VDFRAFHGVVWDWGDTLMRVFPGATGPMVDWPRVEAMPGAQDALRAFQTLPVQCVATNAAESDAAAVAAALARVGLAGYLSHVFTSSDLGAHKPDPAFFEGVVRRLGLPPETLLAVGNDLEKDIVPAKAAGMATVLVGATPARDRAGGADLVVPDLGALADLARR
jgi:putative hydrolase of the HAD superfamily